jgi:hypothetical protein
MSASILIRHLRPRGPNRDGDYLIAGSEFDGGPFLNCDGYQVRPRVKVSIVCQPTDLQKKSIKQRKRRNIMLENSPILE